MTTKAKRILCLLLSMVMLLSLLPVAALADGGTTFDSSWTVLNAYVDAYPAEDGVITLGTGKYYLSADLNLGGNRLQAEHANVIIDLNGYVLEGSSDVTTIKAMGGNLTVQDSNPTTTNTRGGKTFNGGVIFNSDSSGRRTGKAFTMENSDSTLTLTGGTLFSVGANCASLHSSSTLYADGGVIDGKLAVDNAVTITRHDDATDYTTFNGEVSGNPTIKDNAKLTVNFVDGSDTTVATQKVLRGHKLTKPTPDGKLLLSCTKADDTVWDFNTPVTEHKDGVVKLNAKWLGVEGSREGFTAMLGEASTDAITRLVNIARKFCLRKDYLSTFSLKYVDADDKAPATPTTLTISGVTGIDDTKPVYVIATFIDDFMTNCTYRAELDIDGKLSFTISGDDSAAALAGCDVAITQSTLSGDMKVTLPLPQKLEKDGDNYKVIYSVNATSPITGPSGRYYVESFQLYVNGYFKNQVTWISDAFLNATESATLNAWLTRTELTSG